jgi:hypothetical protein
LILRKHLLFAVFRCPTREAREVVCPAMPVIFESSSAANT